MGKQIIRIEFEESIKQKVPIERVRTVYVNENQVYQDRMTVKMAMHCTDPIRKLEEYLLGLEVGQGGKDCSCNTGNLIGLFKKVWRKMFGKCV